MKTPNVEYRKSSATGAWNEAQVKGKLCDPTSAGFGPYSSVVPDDVWIKAALKQIQSEGPEQFLVNMLFMLRASCVDLVAKTDFQSPTSN